jgi:anti-anti-sigma factor
VSPSFSTEVVREDDAIVIHVSGEVDVAAVGRLRDVLEPNMGPQQTIVLDLSGAEFMDSSSHDYLVQALGNLTADGGSLTLRKPLSRSAPTPHAGQGRVPPPGRRGATPL